MKTINSVFNKLRMFVSKLSQIYPALLVAPWRWDYRSDDFEEVFSAGPFILWYDIVTEWIMFVRQKDPRNHVVVFEIPCLIMNILYSLGQFKVRLALGYLCIFLLDTFHRSGLTRSLEGRTHSHSLQRQGRLGYLPASGAALPLQHPRLQCRQRRDLPASEMLGLRPP